MARLFANSSNCDSDSDSDSVGNSNSTRSSFLAAGKGVVVVVVVVVILVAVAAAAIVVIIIARMIIMILGRITTALRMKLVMWHAGPFPKPNSLLAFRNTVKTAGWQRAWCCSSGLHLRVVGFLGFQALHGC